MANYNLTFRTYQYQGGFRNADGTAPRRSEYSDLTANMSSSSTPSPALTAARQELVDFIAFDNKSRDAASNLFRAHKQAIGALIAGHESCRLTGQRTA